MHVAAGSGQFVEAPRVGAGPLGRFGRAQVADPGIAHPTRVGALLHPRATGVARGQPGSPGDDRGRPGTTGVTRGRPGSPGTVVAQGLPGPKSGSAPITTAATYRIRSSSTRPTRSAWLYSWDAPGSSMPRTWWNSRAGPLIENAIPTTGSASKPLPANQVR